MIALDHFIMCSFLFSFFLIPLSILAKLEFERLCVFSCVCWRIRLHLSLSISAWFSWIISETETVSHVFYFQSLCAFELRHLSIDEEESEPIACGWQKFSTLCQAPVSVPDIMGENILI